MDAKVITLPESLFRDLLEAIKDAIIWEADPASLQFTFVGQSAAAILGYPIEQWMSEPDFRASHIHPDDREQVMRLCREAISRSEDHVLEYRMLAADGRAVWLRDSVYIGLDGQGRVQQLRGVIVDITDIKTAQRRLAAQHAVTRVLGESATLGKAAPKMLQAICEGLDWELGALWIVDRDEGVLICEEIWHTPSRAKEFRAISRQVAFPPGIGLPGRVWTSGEPAWIPNVVEDSNFPRAPIAAREGLHGAFAFPILRRGEVLGVMEFFSSDIRQPDQDLLDMMAAIGSQIGQFLESDEALRQAEEKYRAIFENAVFGIFQTTPEGRFISANPALARMFGYDSPEELKSTIQDIGRQIHVDQERRAEFVRLVEENDRVFDFESEAHHKDGSTIWISLSARTIRDKSGKVLYYEGFVEDISERKKAEEELRISQEQFAKAFHASPAAISIVRARDRSFVDVNDSFLALLAYRRDEIIGRTATELGIWADPADPGRMARLLDREGCARNLEGTLRTKSGEIVQVLGSVEIINIGGETCVLALFHDISERKRSEETQRFLSETSALLAASLDYSQTLASVARLAVPYLGDWCAIVVLEEDGSIRQVAVVHKEPSRVELAERLQERYPFDPDSPYGVANVLRTGQSEFYPEIPDSLVVAAARDAEHLRIIRELGLKSAMTVPLLARGRTLGAITFVSAESGRRYDRIDLALAEELGRRAGLAVDNARLYAELQQANEAKDEFLGLISHELRTPITAIYGGARVLRSRAERLDDESKAGIVADIEQESERLYRMVEDLLVLARLDLGQELAAEPVLAQRVIQKQAEAFAKRRPGRQIDLHLEEDLEPVAAESTYLEQILRNLLSNADKYTTADSPIDIDARPNDQGEIVISVLDRGPGIPPQEADRIFERFYRSGRTSKQARGAGMGLTVCKRLVEAQSGRIWAQPRQGGGLEVSFTLPLYKEDSE